MTEYTITEYTITEYTITEYTITSDEFFANKFPYNQERLQFCTNNINKIFFDNIVYVKDQRGDGNCLLRALLDALGDNDITIEKINELKEELLLSCKGILSNDYDIITDETFEFDTNSPEYTLPLLHFALLRNIKIVLIQLDPYNSFESRKFSTFTFKHPTNDNTNVIFLLCFASHISLLIPQVPCNDILPVEWNRILYNMMIENNLI